MKLTATIAALLALTACASPDDARVATAMATPFNDFNLVQAAIPPVLQEAQRQPYLQPSDASCAALAPLVAALDEALGPDLDAPASSTNPSLIERSGDLAAGALQSAVQGVVPFRGWVRKLSGAERYAKQVAAAIAAGSVRRGFLKGLRAAQGC